MITHTCAVNVRLVQRRASPSLCLVFQGYKPFSTGKPQKPRSTSASLSAFTEESREEIVKEAERLDAVIVLGGGLRISQNAPLGEIPPWAIQRLDGAAQIWSLSQPSRMKIAISGGGSPHGLPVIHPETGQVVHEGTAYAEYLMQSHGISPLSILKESSSYDTVGNGYFSSMIHAVPSRWKRVAVVTSEFHMPRSRAIFQKVYGLVNEALCPEKQQIHLVFASVRDDHAFKNPRVLEARKKKELASLETWERNMESVTCLQDFHEWFYATHVCYSCSRQDEFGIGCESDPNLKDSY